MSKFRIYRYKDHLSKHSLMHCQVFTSGNTRYHFIDKLKINATIIIIIFYLSVISIINMAAAGESTCHSDPNFAVICSFLDKYGELLGLPEIPFIDLQDYLEDTKSGAYTSPCFMQWIGCVFMGRERFWSAFCRKPQPRTISFILLLFVDQVD